MKVGRELFGERKGTRRRWGKRLTGGLNSFRVYINMDENVIVKFLFLYN